MVWLWLFGALGGAEASPPDSGPGDPLEEEGAGGALPGGADPKGMDGLPANPAVSAVPLGEERWTVPVDVLDAVRAVRERPVGERIEAATRAFLGLPYLNDAAGELDGVDPDPPSRYEAFDCLTFVEEALGLALAGDPLHAPAVRDALRYRGAPAYTTRRHFMEAQWIPDAIANGLVEDITARVGRARLLKKDVTLDTWKRWARRALFRLPDAALPVGTWSLAYLDLTEA
ncbi:MAG: N-acetylmuramoyl-L-alanine amidase-like domain-containing protein, partial [Myxococcota bacterium]